MDALETATGIQLFVRKQGTMRLTPAGKELWTAFKKFRASMEQEILRAHELQEGYNKTLAVSFPLSVDPQKYLKPMTDRFRQKHFPLRIRHFLEQDFDDTLNKLISYKLDIAITHLHNRKKVEQYRNLSYKPICYTPLCAFMLESNPLCASTSLTISDL